MPDILGCQRNRSFEKALYIENMIFERAGEPLEPGLVNDSYFFLWVGKPKEEILDKPLMWQATAAEWKGLSNSETNVVTMGSLAHLTCSKGLHP